MPYQRRIYPLDPRQLSQEQLAVVFAMTSRRPEPFDEIAKLVTQEKAADFHEKWVLNYGHASVAEHAIIHMAVENISRLACDSLEDNRLASYTEKSSRYQVLEPGYYFTPPEISGSPLEKVYLKACDRLFEVYRRLLEGTQAHLRQVYPRGQGERESAYSFRLRRIATDSCRFVLPASTLTNVGVTMNARSLEHAIRKLLSSELAEEREIGQELKEQGREITPTLIKYADYNPYMADTYKAQRRVVKLLNGQAPAQTDTDGIRLVHWDPQAEDKVLAALLYRFSEEPYQALWGRVKAMTQEEKEGVVHEALSRLKEFDIPLRELEFAHLTFDLIMDYGAYREFKRHRMQSYIPQPLTVAHGYVVPELILQAGLEDTFVEAMQVSQTSYTLLYPEYPLQAQYLVTHAHNRRVLSQMSLRECYHLFKLRTSSQAHFTIRAAMQRALELAREVHPLLFRFLKLRD